MGKTRDLFKKIRDTKGTFHAKMSTIQDRNGIDLTETEDIKKRWQEYTEELYKKRSSWSKYSWWCVQQPRARHSGIWSQVGPRKHHYKASGGDGIFYFKSSEMMLWKCCTQYASKFGKLSSGHRTGNGHFSFQSQKKAMPKNAQTTAQLHSSHTQVK